MPDDAPVMTAIRLRLAGEAALDQDDMLREPTQSRHMHNVFATTIAG
jgi:hypothetical protein